MIDLDLVPDCVIKEAIEESITASTEVTVKYQDLEKLHYAEVEPPCFVVAKAQLHMK